MSIFSSLSTRAKLGVGFGLVGILIIVLAFFAWRELGNVGRELATQNAVRTTKLERLYALRESLAQTGLAARNAYIIPDTMQAQGELSLLDEHKANFLKELQALAPLFEGNADFATMRAGLLRMAEELNRPRRYRDAGQMTEYGAFLVNECSPLRRQNVLDIVTSVQHVSGIIEEITAASEAQHAGIQEVNLAVDQMDAATQQNAVLVEQSAASAAALNEQAGSLLRTVRVFRINAENQPLRIAA